MRWWSRRDGAGGPGVDPVLPADPDLPGWAETATELADRLGPAGSFVVTLLGESLTRPRPTSWFGYAPDAEGLDQLLSSLGETGVDAAALLEAEISLRGRHLGSVPAEVASAWRSRLSESATRVRGAGVLPERDSVHVSAEEIWIAAARQASAPPMVLLDPLWALSQVRWFPGVATRTFVGYSDPLNLSTVQRSTLEAGLTRAQHDALAQAQQVVDRPVDPLRWRLSCLAFAAERRPWESP